MTRFNFMFNIIITGPQGSGKGTQAKFLAEELNLEHIEAGRLLRGLVDAGGVLGKKISEYLLAGTLVPTPILINEVLKPRLEQVAQERGIVFDGIPRRLVEALALEEMIALIGRKITHVFYIQISEEETYLRLGKRLTCRKCNQPLIAGVDVGGVADQCPHCGGELYQREDDTKKSIQKRLEVFQKETMLVIEHFRGKSLVHTINGAQSIPKVHQDIMAVMNNA